MLSLRYCPLTLYFRLDDSFELLTVRIPVLFRIKAGREAVDQCLRKIQIPVLNQIGVGFVLLFRAHFRTELHRVSDQP